MKLCSHRRAKPIRIYSAPCFSAKPDKKTALHSFAIHGIIAALAAMLTTNVFFH
jgi:hypothetical protein